MIEEGAAQHCQSLARLSQPATEMEVIPCSRTLYRDGWVRNCQGPPGTNLPDFLSTPCL